MEQFDVTKEIGNSAWIDSFQIELNSTRALFDENLKKFSDSASVLRRRQEPIRKLRKTLQTLEPESVEAVNQLFKECKSLESDLEEFESGPKEWEQEGNSQILFTQEWAKPLNQIPFVLPAAAIFKIYIVPFFAVILPLIAWFLPFLIIRVFFGVPIAFNTYKDMMINMWLGGRTWNTLDFWGQIRILFQSAWTVFGLAQGIYQPIQQAMHTKSLDATIVRHGTSLQRFVRLADQTFRKLEALHGKPISCPTLHEIPLDEPRATYAYVRDHGSDLKWIWRKLAEQEIIWRFATAAHLNFVIYTSTPNQLILNNFFDPSIPAKDRVPSTLVLQEPMQHSVLTGPNKGGKSSALRALCLNVWLAQTYGMAFATSVYMKPFNWIRSGLRLADLPGTESMFEREIQFATETLRMATSGKSGIVLYDECFHSTNPPDGEKTAKIFLETLWKTKKVLSVVSTHVFSLVESAPPQIQRLCVPAEATPQGIVYSFRLAPGICKVSSVEELYKKFGFPTGSASKTASESGSL